MRTPADNATRTADRPQAAAPEARHRWAEIVRALRWAALGLVGGAVGLLVLLAGGAAASAATAHGSTAQGSIDHGADTGYTLCAAPSGTVTFTTTTCPGGDTTLSVGQQSQVKKLSTEVTTLESEVATLTTKLSGDSTTITNLKTLLTGVTRSSASGYQTLTFSGENVQIVNGTGTEATADGLGNLIVGYNENPGSQTGSHNLIVGSGQTDTSYGSLVAGLGNTVSGPFTSVSGGEYNDANDEWSSISGGCDNITAQAAAPTGPCSQYAESIVGGASNVADGTLSSILGGQSNQASGDEATISGGLTNFSEGTGTSVSGGYGNSADAQQSSILGGGENTTTGDVSSIAGGYYNTATADEATVLGGCSNLAGSGNLSIESLCYDFGNSFMSVVGGIGNNSETLGSVIAGGTGNVISGGQTDSIAGGHNETLSLVTLYLSRIGNTSYNP